MINFLVLHLFIYIFFISIKKVLLLFWSNISCSCIIFKIALGECNHFCSTLYSYSFAECIKKTMSLLFCSWLWIIFSFWFLFLAKYDSNMTFRLCCFEGQKETNCNYYFLFQVKKSNHKVSFVKFCF